MARRIASVTLALARSALEPTRRSRPAQSDSPCELTREETPFGHGLLRSMGVAALACFFKVGLDLGEAPAVRLFRAPVEHLAGIARQRARRLPVDIAVVRRCGALVLDDEIDRVDLASRLREQPREIPQTLCVAQPRGAVVERDGPVVGFATEPMLFRRRARADLARGRRRGHRGGLRRRWQFESIEHGASRCRLGVAPCAMAGRGQCLAKQQARRGRFVRRDDVVPLIRGEGARD